MRFKTFLLMFFLGSMPHLSAQTTWYVDQSGGGDFVGIQQAIDSPNVFDGDTVLVRPGTYAENLDFQSKNITLASVSGPASTRIAPASGRAVFMAPAITSATVLEGFTITGRATTEGGGIWAQGSPIVRECVFKDCYAGQEGGAISCRSSILIQNCVFEDNEAGDAGGAVRYKSGESLTVSGCRFSRNFAGADGGAIQVSHPSSITGSSHSITDSTFEENVVDGGNHLSHSGGAIYIRIESDTTIERCHFISNIAGSTSRPGLGAAIYSNVKADIAIADSPFWGNDSGRNDSYASTIYFTGIDPPYTASIDHCTVAGNAGGIRSYNNGLPRLRISNSIVWGNEGNDIEALVDGSYSNLGGASNGQGCIDQDPLFIDPQNGDFHLRPESPCVNTGDPNYSLDYNQTITDMGYFTLNPQDLDTDDDGLADLDESNLFSTDPITFDTDGDGLSDGLELGVDTPTSESNPLIFVPDLDPSTQTNPLQADSDFGGLSDDIEDGNKDGRLDTWETDPNAPNDDSFAAYFSGIVPGGKVHIEVWGATPYETIIPAYSLKGPGPSPTGLGILVDLSRPITLMDPFLSDAEGRASVDRLPVPNSAPLGLSVWMQVVEVPLSNNLQPRASNPAMVPVGGN
jgi:hypothetical protein